jgi:hypothetical protein
VCMPSASPDSPSPGGDQQSENRCAWETMESVGATRAEDTPAIDIYRRAEESGDEITLGTMERRLSELLSHEPGCTK